MVFMLRTSNTMSKKDFNKYNKIEYDFKTSAKILVTTTNCTRKEDKICFIGIDPGTQGGICVIDQNKEIVFLAQLSKDLIEVKSVLVKLNEIVQWYENSNCLIEKVSSRPGQGVVSTMTFGKAVGRLEMGIALHNIPFGTVEPKIWMKTVGISIPKSLGKSDRSKFKRNRAIELFPKFPLWNVNKTEVMQCEVADSILIALASLKLSTIGRVKPPQNK